jgi:hypothetical protein
VSWFRDGVRVNENSIVLPFSGNGNRCLSKNAVELSRSPVFVKVPKATIGISSIEEKDEFDKYESLLIPCYCCN